MVRKSKKQTEGNKNEQRFDLSDLVQGESLSKLKEAGKKLKAEEKKQQEEEVAQRIQKRKEREKNKSFEELFHESNLDWRHYK